MDKTSRSAETGRSVESEDTEEIRRGHGRRQMEHLEESQEGRRVEGRSEKRRRKERRYDEDNTMTEDNRFPEDNMFRDGRGSNGRALEDNRFPRESSRDSRRRRHEEDIERSQRRKDGDTRTRTFDEVVQIDDHEGSGSRYKYLHFCKVICISYVFISFT